MNPAARHIHNSNTLFFTHIVTKYLGEVKLQGQWLGTATTLPLSAGSAPFTSTTWLHWVLEYIYQTGIIVRPNRAWPLPAILVTEPAGYTDRPTHTQAHLWYIFSHLWHIFFFTLWYIYIHIYDIYIFTFMILLTVVTSFRWQTPPLQPVGVYGQYIGTWDLSSCY